MADWNAINAFIGAVIAWPGASDPGYANLQYSYHDKRSPDGKRNGKWPVSAGMPYRDISQMLSRAGWINTSGFNKDVWFCTSLQRETAVGKTGKTIAKRSAMGALLQKSIWIDADVDPSDPKKYDTVEEALRSILTFQKTAGLPRPSAIVFSGGGIHVYWISHTPLTPQEWQPFASGLRNMLLANNIKCDGGLTTDISRILRMPGTFNHKYDPPKPVELSPLPLKLYDFEKQLAILKSFAGPTVTPAAFKPTQSLFAEGVDPAAFKAGPNPLFKGLLQEEPGLEAGIDKFADNLVDPKPIFAKQIHGGCEFYRDAIKTKGANHTQPLWNLAVLGTTFMENGNAIAHEISKGHAEYTALDTQALYDRKMAERHDRGIGYPSCAAIEANGCSACKACPLRDKGKSPLNIKPPPVTATVTPQMGQSPAAAAVGLPDGFDLDHRGIICKVIELTTKEGETLPPNFIPLFQAQLSNFRLRKEPGEHLEFKATADKGHTVDVSVSMGEVGGMGFVNYILKKRLLIDVKGEKFLKEFFLSIIGKMRALMAAQTSVSFGWYEEDGKRRGFAYGGTLYMDDGSERDAAITDPNLSDKYKPKGSIDAWRKACATVTGRKRPELTSIVLLAFASPLLALNGKNTACLAAFGKDSGAGKTAASRVGTAVWGHPLANKITNRDTPNSIMGRLASLRNLPFYWDEVKDKYKAKFSEVLTELDGGSEKHRMTDGEHHQAAGMFQLMLMYTGNASMVEYLRKESTETTAPYMRVLEYGPVKRIDGGPGHMKNADAEILLDAMQRNYGHMGALYSKFLATNLETITEEFRLKCNEIEEKMVGGNSERYWYTAVAAISLAAKYASQLGVDCNQAEIEAFQIECYKQNFKHREAYAPGGDQDNSEAALSGWLRARESNDRGVWSDKMWLSQGKPGKDFIVNRIHSPTSASRNPQGAIVFRYATETMTLVIDEHDFDLYLQEVVKTSPMTIYNDMEKTYRMASGRIQIMSGLPSNAGREYVKILRIRPNTPLWDHMLQWTPAPERDLITARASAEAEMIADAIESGTLPLDADLVYDKNGLATPHSVAAAVMKARKHA